LRIFAKYFNWTCAGDKAAPSGEHGRHRPPPPCAVAAGRGERPRTHPASPPSPAREIAFLPCPWSSSIYNSEFLIAMDKDTYNSLTEDERAAVDNNSGAAFSAQLGRFCDEIEERGRNAFAGAGGNVTFVKGTTMRPGSGPASRLSTFGRHARGHQPYAAGGPARLPWIARSLVGGSSPREGVVGNGERVAKLPAGASRPHQHG
jgi:hypothetical protein